MKKQSSNSPKKIKKAKLNWGKIAIRTNIVIFIVIGIIANIPITYDTTESTSLAYGTQYMDEPGIELGEERTSQEGIAGKQTVTYKNRQSIIDYLLGRKNAKKELVDSSIQTQATEKVILKGTRKWQYMMCSNGIYRYFTDEEFKEPNIGFTSNSPDYCEQHNDGKRIGLADSPNGTNKGFRFSNVPSSCTRFEIPYKTVYQNVSWLNTGQTQDGYGINGFKYVCAGGTDDIVVNPVNKIVYRGTSQRTTSIPEIPSSLGPDYQAKYKCDSEYSRAKAALAMGNASNSSVALEVEKLYRQCLSRAGF